MGTRERHRVCTRRFRVTDFAEEDFSSPWMSSENMSAFVNCLYDLRTRHRMEKMVYAGGVHYPTLITTHHTKPPVSTSVSSWCWLDEVGVARNGLDPTSCCDTEQYGPQGLEACWDGHFTFELCCLRDVQEAELPHFFVAPAFDINVGNA